MPSKGMCVALATISFLLLTENSYSSYTVAYYPNGEASGGQVIYSDHQPTTQTYKRTYRHQYTYTHQYTHRYTTYHAKHHKPFHPYASRIPNQITSPGEKVVIVNPNVHVWGAYSADGKLVRAGLASAGSSWCPDLGHPCHTKMGTFRVQSLGSSRCVSKKFPLGRGGAPMPYCMYFNNSQALHGSYELAEANISHGCVRMSVEDARWLRFNFVGIGTKVIIKQY